MYDLITSKQKDKLTDEIKEEIQKRQIWWSDDRLCHWFFDFKVGDVWVSVKHINNELTECVVDLWEEEPVEEESTSL